MSKSTHTQEILMQLKRVNQAFSLREQQYSDREQSSVVEISILREKITFLQTEMVEKDREIDALIQCNIDTIQAQSLAQAQQLTECKLAFDEQLTTAEQTRVYGEREKLYEAEIAALRQTLAQAETAAAEQERCLIRDAQENLDNSRSETQRQVELLIERERFFSEKLVQIQEEARLTTAEQTRVYGEREKLYEAEIAALRQTLAQAETAAAEQERCLIRDAQENLDNSRSETQRQVELLIERERFFSEKLVQIQEEARLTTAEQTRVYGEREKLYEAEIAALRQTLAQAETAAAEQERCLIRDAQENLDNSRSETQRQVELLIERERFFSEKLVQIQEEARLTTAEQTRVYGEREKLYEAEIAALRQTLAQAETAAAEQERCLIRDAQENLDNSRSETQRQVELLIERERFFSEKLVQIQEEARLTTAEQTRVYGEREKTSQKQLIDLSERLKIAQNKYELIQEAQCKLDSARIEAEEQMRQQIDSERALRAQLLQVELTASELSHKILNAQHREDKLLADLDQKTAQAATFAEEISRMQKMYSWKLTTPFRHVRAWLQPNDQTIRIGSPDTSMFEMGSLSSEKPKIRENSSYNSEVK